MICRLKKTNIKIKKMPHIKLVFIASFVTFDTSLTIHRICADISDNIRDSRHWNIERI